MTVYLNTTHGTISVLFNPPKEVLRTSANCAGEVIHIFFQSQAIKFGAFNYNPDLLRRKLVSNFKLLDDVLDAYIVVFTFD